MINKIKILGMLLNVGHWQVQKKHITKKSDRFHHHSNLLTTPELSQLFVCHVKGPLSFVRKCRKSWLPQGRRGRRVILPSTQEWFSPHATYMWKGPPEAGLTSSLVHVPLSPCLLLSLSVDALYSAHSPGLRSVPCFSWTVPWFYLQRYQQPLHCLYNHNSKKYEPMYTIIATCCNNQTTV